MLVENGKASRESRFKRRNTWLAVVGIALSAGCGGVSDPKADPDAGDPVDGAPAVSDADLTPDAAAPCVASPAGLRARWRGEMDSGDETGVYDAVAQGGVTYSAGQHGNAFVLDGADDFLTADAGDQLYPAASFSVELWVNTNSIMATLLSKYDKGGTEGGSAAFYSIYIDDGGRAAFGFRVVGGSGVVAVKSLEAVNDGEWHHLVGVRDVGARLALLYVDGEKVAERAIDLADLEAITNADGASDPLTVGAGRLSASDGYDAYLLGAIDEISYYETAVSASQVAAIYAAPEGICP